jgi:hypothetical protein
MLFLQLFLLSQNQHQILRFYAHIAFLKEKQFWSHMSTFYKFWRQTPTKWLKKQNFFYKCVLELNFATIVGPGRTKLFKPLYPNIYSYTVHTCILQKAHKYFIFIINRIKVNIFIYPPTNYIAHTRMMDKLHRYDFINNIDK